MTLKQFNFTMILLVKSMLLRNCNVHKKQLQFHTRFTLDFARFVQFDKSLSGFLGLPTAGFWFNIFCSERREKIELKIRYWWL